ncbi:inactive hydroxysteroid dehydrogenase-like protein 1 [Plakobranchus ocellatus]|uniref:Inactive hydroxysteroid dehydrogenase-like protein 1 n=1 Tax=Plakobranchus ocellatus TaxID=259542 RepID=A0AAV4DHB5_9GAST|nr:inactive hydroxysteroid dehydrogenase-like protein 1 [Plakobranchus ocellatus]
MKPVPFTIDSFKFVLDQVVEDLKGVFAGTNDILAILGAYYAARRVYGAVSTVAEAVYVHLLGRATNVDWVKNYGPWAVVTGSSEGIGRAYANELALRGLNIVLISRNERRLARAKSEIEMDCKVNVQYIVADFAAENQGDLYKTIETALADKEVGLLVNNVGVMYDYPDVLLNITQQKLWQLIYVNIGAATMMTHMLLPGMVERGKGGVVVVSSGSSTQMTPQMTVYSATKRYLDYFIHSLAYEYRDSGVTFQCLIPFYTATRMTGYSERLSKGGWIVPDASRYANSAIETFGRSQCTTGYFPHTLQLWIGQAVPNWLWMWGSEKLNNSLRKEALARLAKRATKYGSQEVLSDANKS